jgi:hypothetical protein
MTRNCVHCNRPIFDVSPFRVGDVKHVPVCKPFVDATGRDEPQNRSPWRKR